MYAAHAFRHDGPIEVKVFLTHNLATLQQLVLLATEYTALLTPNAPPPPPPPRTPTPKPAPLPRHDAPIVVKAFLTHDLATLKQHIGKELEERMGGMFKFFEAAVSGEGCKG